MKTAAARPRLQAITPLLVVKDLQRAVDFYIGKIGFVDPAIHGKPPCFAMMNRDGFDLMLSLEEPTSTGRANGPGGTWDVYLRVADLGAEIAALTAAGVAISKGPTDTFYEMREIEVLDPDGHRLCFAHDISLPTHGGVEIWEGALDIGFARLRLVLNLTSLAAGGLAASVDSPDQNAMNLPVDVVVTEGSTLRFEMRGIAAKFEGAFEGPRLEGQWSQGGSFWPLVFLKRV